MAYLEDSDIITVDPMDRNLCHKVLKKELGAYANREDVIELAAALEFMPLAIVQAAAYIRQRAPRFSVPQYLNKFRKSNSQKISHLDYEGGHLRRDREARNSVLVTWQISLDYIRQMRLSAADLLSLINLFDIQGIHDSLL